MIMIDILNAEEIASNHAGKFKIMVARTLGINLKKRIEMEMAQKLKVEMQENGLIVDVRVQD
jgi:hypothetical protein